MENIENNRQTGTKPRTLLMYSKNMSLKASDGVHILNQFANHR